MIKSPSIFSSGTPSLDRSWLLRSTFLSDPCKCQCYWLIWVPSQGNQVLLTLACRHSEHGRRRTGTL
jgi:hypothetical protein